MLQMSRLTSLTCIQAAAAATAAAAAATTSAAAAQGNKWLRTSTCGSDGKGEWSFPQASIARDAGGLQQYAAQPCKCKSAYKSTSSASDASKAPLWLNGFKYFNYHICGQQLLLATVSCKKQQHETSRYGRNGSPLSISCEAKLYVLTSAGPPTSKLATSIPHFSAFPSDIAPVSKPCAPGLATLRSTLSTAAAAEFQLPARYDSQMKCS